MPSFLIVGYPLTDRLFHSVRDMDHLSFLAHPDGEIKARVKFASGAPATRFSAGPLHGDQTAT